METFHLQGGIASFEWKGAKWPRKIRITVHWNMKFSQLGIWFFLSFWTKFKFGFSQVLEESPIYNFPIYGFWSLFAIFGELCKGTGAHATDRGRERASATSRARTFTRHSRAAAVRRRTTAPPRSLRVSESCVSPARTSSTRLGRWARAPRGVRALAAAPSLPAARAHRCCRYTSHLNVLVASLRSKDASARTQL
jgi:hypothetical protein